MHQQKQQTNKQPNKFFPTYSNAKRMRQRSPSRKGNQFSSFSQENKKKWRKKTKRKRKTHQENRSRQQIFSFSLSSTFFLCFLLKFLFVLLEHFSLQVQIVFLLYMIGWNLQWKHGSLRSRRKLLLLFYTHPEAGTFVEATTCCCNIVFYYLLCDIIK